MCVRKRRVWIPFMLMLCLLSLLTGCSDSAEHSSGTEASMESGGSPAEDTEDSRDSSPVDRDADAGPPDGEADAGPPADETDAARNAEMEQYVSRLVDAMSLEEKASQMIIPAIRTWGNDRKGVTDLSRLPALAEALRCHQYGGIILFGSNIVDTEQTVRLIHDLQANNAQSSDAVKTGFIPYLIAADQEGGSVARLRMGTRGTGSMAIGAAGAQAEQCALTTGQIFGEELAALGINVNLGPCLDVITDLTDPGMSTRVFSDQPETAAKLGIAFMNGVSRSGVITTCKHFPGAGDGSDYPTSVKLTRAQLEETGLLAFRTALANGVEMVMTAATTFPLLDQEVLMADGVTTGYYPATLSPEIVTGMLREELSFDGVVITDALEMEQFIIEPDNRKALFSGSGGTVKHDLQTAERAVNAGCDLLLIPADLNGQDAVQYYDSYIAGIVRLVEEGTVSIQRIDASVRRILKLKYRHGLFDMDTSGADLEARIEMARQTVGSAEHHAAESEIAAKSITLLKNDGVIPVSTDGMRIVIIGRTSYDSTPICYALSRLMRDGFMDPRTRIENYITGEYQGDEKASTKIVIDCYNSTSHGGSLLYSKKLSAAVRNADVVICLSAVGAGLDALQDSNPVMKGVSRALSEAHNVGAAFVLLSTNLPVDAARFQNADAIVCAYLSAGFGIDPTARTSGSENVGAFNANVPAALRAIFGAADMSGTLPVRIPALVKEQSGRWTFHDDVLYNHGYAA